MFDLNQWTQKAREAIQLASTISTRYGQQAVDTPHLLRALLEDANGLVAQLLQRVGCTLAQLQAQTDEALDRIPRVSGNVESGKIYLTPALEKLALNAETAPLFTAAKSDKSSFLAISAARSGRDSVTVLL